MTIANVSLIKCKVNHFFIDLEIISLYRLFHELSIDFMFNDKNSKCFMWRKLYSLLKLMKSATSLLYNFLFVCGHVHFSFLYFQHSNVQYNAKHMYVCEFNTCQT